MKRPGASLLALLLLLEGCALISKATPIEMRYFSPEPQTTVRAATLPPAMAAPRIRLGRVTSSAHLRSKIVFRHSAVELATYEDRRWTENPEAYVRRALVRTLFEGGSMIQAVGGPYPALDVELIAFEEVRHQGTCSGRVELSYVLHDDKEVLATGHVDVQHPAHAAAMEDVVAAIGGALEDAATQLAVQVQGLVSQAGWDQLGR